MIPEKLKYFGSRMKRLIYDPEINGFLDGIGRDWGAGGCWILAAAIAEYLGPPARLLAVRGRNGIPVHHVVVEDGGVYLDYRGAQTMQELHANLAEDKVPDVDPVPFTIELQDIAYKNLMIPYDAEVVGQLVTAFRERLGQR